MSKKLPFRYVMYHTRITDMSSLLASEFIDYLENAPDDGHGDALTFQTLIKCGARILYARDTKNKNVMCGYIAYVPRGNGIVELDSLHVHEDFREAGIGSMMLEALISRYKKIWAAVVDDNLNALAFYKKRGFHILPFVMPNYFNKFNDMTDGGESGDAVVVSNYDEATFGMGEQPKWYGNFAIKIEQETLLEDFKE